MSTPNPQIPIENAPVRPTPARPIETNNCWHGRRDAFIEMLDKTMERRYAIDRENARTRNVFDYQFNKLEQEIDKTDRIVDGAKDIMKYLCFTAIFIAAISRARVTFE